MNSVTKWCFFCFWSIWLTLRQNWPETTPSCGCENMSHYGCKTLLRHPIRSKTCLNIHLVSLETKPGGFSVCRTFQHERNDRHRKKDKNFRILSPYYGRFWHMRPGSRFWVKMCLKQQFSKRVAKGLAVIPKYSRVTSRCFNTRLATEFLSFARKLDVSSVLRTL